MRKPLIGALISAAATSASAQHRSGRARHRSSHRARPADRSAAPLGARPRSYRDRAGAPRRRAGLQGPLAGQPVLIKDNIEAAGPLPTTAGSLALASNVTNRDAPLVARLRAAGGSLSARPTLANGRTSAPTIRSPAGARSAARRATRGRSTATPAGRSSGSGAAVAAGLVRLAIGTETDGSITCPAAINGIVGLKPTVGLVSRTYVVPISHSQDTAGPMTAQRARSGRAADRDRRQRPRRPGDSGGRHAQAQLCRAARRQLAQGQAHRRYALRLGLRHRRRVRYRAGDFARARRHPGRDQEVRREGHRQERVQRPADRVQGRSRPNI